MTRAHIAAVTIAAALLGLVPAAPADSAKFPLKGLVKSGSGAGTGSAPVVVVDDAAEPSTAAGSGKVTVLTQACFRVDANNTVTLAAGGLIVPFAASNSNGGAGCVAFGAGYVVPEGIDVTCAATGVAAFSCTASGVVSKQQ